MPPRGTAPCVLGSLADLKSGRADVSMQGFQRKDLHQVNGKLLTSVELHTHQAKERQRKATAKGNSKAGVAERRALAKEYDHLQAAGYEPYMSKRMWTFAGEAEREWYRKQARAANGAGGGRKGRAARAEHSYQNDLRQWLRTPGGRAPTKKLTRAEAAYKKALAATDDGMGAVMVGGNGAGRSTNTG